MLSESFTIKDDEHLQSLKQYIFLFIPPDILKITVI